MPVYSQGEDYEEEDLATPTPKATARRTTPTPEPAESPPEEEEVHDPPKQRGKFQFNAKLAACIAALIALLIIIVLITGWINSNADKKAQEEQRQEALRIAAEKESYYAEHPEERPTVADTVTGETSADTPAPVQTGSYSLDELKVLRKWGYTAAEIEAAQRDGITPQGLVKQAKKDREDAQKEALMAVFDTASPEYQRLYNMTWLSGDSIDLSGVNPDAVYNTLQHTENVDYEKCGAQGTQLFIKLYLDDGTNAFMTVTPGRYVTLADSGNIVVSISEVEMGGIKVIVDVREVAVK